MSNASKYRKKAVEYEQLKQFDRAVASYVRAIEENENAGEEVDVALFNKVGDLTLRQGRVTDAVTYYERAVEHYVSNTLFDNAIALCNKILRNAPGRSNVYFTLGRICGRKGLRADATRNFLEYATRMQQEGRVDEGMRALAEVADLMPELTEVRRLVEEHAARAGISLSPRRRNTPVRAAAQVDGEPVRSFGLSKDLVFLEIDYDAVKAARGLTPAPQRSVAAEADAVVASRTSDPAASATKTKNSPLAEKSTARLEDLMIFDPRGDTGAFDDLADEVVVDGASIIKPYADPATPVEALVDLEPTEFKGTPAHADAIGSAETMPDMLQRGVTPRAPGEESRTDTPVVVTRVATVPNFPAVLEVEHVAPLAEVDTGIREELFVEIASDAVLTGDERDDVIATMESVDSTLDIVDESVSDVVAKDVVTAVASDDDALIQASVLATPVEISGSVEAIQGGDLVESDALEPTAAAPFIEPVEQLSVADIAKAIDDFVFVDSAAVVGELAGVDVADVIDEIGIVESSGVIDELVVVEHADAIDEISVVERAGVIDELESADSIDFVDEAFVADIPVVGEPIAIDVPRNSLETDAITDSREPLEPVATAVALESPEEIVTVGAVESFEQTTAFELTESIVTSDSLVTADVILEKVTDDSSSNDILNFAVEHELNLSLPAAQLEGFTADEEPPVAADLDLSVVAQIVKIEDVSNVVHVAENDVLPSLDFDAMLEMSSPEIETVADLQAEEFTPANDGLAASRFVRDEVSNEPELVDEFESAVELPPLIFPMSADTAIVEPIALVVQSTTDEFPEIVDLELPAIHDFDTGEFGEVTASDPFKDIGELIDVAESNDGARSSNAIADFVFLELPESGTGALTPIDLDVVTESGLDLVEFEAASDAEHELPSVVQNADTTDLLSTIEFDPFSDEAFDDAYDTTYDPHIPDPSELPFIVSTEALAAAEDDPFFEVASVSPIDALAQASDNFGEVSDDLDDLDDLFGDTDLPTATVAAEAALAVSSRCTELRTASLADPENFVLRRRLAEALFEFGNRDEAISELKIALIGAEEIGSITVAADIADELVRVAGDELSHHQKRLELAIRIGDQSRLREAYLDLADNLVRRGEDLRAKAVYARVLEIDPWDDRARTALGDAAPPPPARTPAVVPDEGHVSLADWLRDDDEPVSTRLRMAEPDITGDEQDDFNALLKHFKEGVARSLGEDDYESHYDLGVAYKEMGLLDDAIGEFQMALRSRSNRLAAYEALGQCFIEQQSYKVAVTVLSRALHEPAIQDEQRVGVLYLLGFSCEVLQRFDEARGYFQRVYATDIHFRDVNQRLADLERTVR